MKENLFLNSMSALAKPPLNLLVVSNNTTLCTWPGATANKRVTQDRAINLPGFSVDPISKFFIYINFNYRNFDVLLTVHLSVFISVINQLDAQNVCFTISLLFHASTCFEHMCSSSGGQNCITQPIGVTKPKAV